MLHRRRPAAGARPAFNRHRPEARRRLDTGGTGHAAGCRQERRRGPVGCHFVPAGPYSCDTPTCRATTRGSSAMRTSWTGWRRRASAPFKPYFALPEHVRGWGIHGNVTYDISDDLELVWIGSCREYKSKFGQDQDADAGPGRAARQPTRHRAWSQELRLNFEFGRRPDRRHRRRVLFRPVRRTTPRAST